MKTIGFVTNSSLSSGIYRGMDAYAKYLLAHLSKIAKDTNLRIVEIAAPEQLSKSNYDLYHFPMFSLFRPTIPFLLPKPYVVTVHDVTRLEFSGHYPPGIKGRFTINYQKLLLNRSQVVITDSHSSVGQIVKYLHLPHSKIRMVHLAADEIFKPLSDNHIRLSITSKYHLPNRFVLFNGDVDWNKNMLNLIQACRKTQTNLVIYGKSPRDLLDHPEYFPAKHRELSHLTELRQLLQSDQVYVLGYIPDKDLVPIFNLATVYCQPSFAEGFGIPVLQAMACGTPVICSHTHSLPEIAGEAAIYFDPYDISSIASCITKVLTSTKLHSDLKSKGLNQVKKYSWDKTAAETIKVYQEVLPA